MSIEHYDFPNNVRMSLAYCIQYFKALHPLLEEGVYAEDEGTLVRCGFIGISNWALDPAKMNRGLFVQRGKPDESELKLIAE